MHDPLDLAARVLQRRGRLTQRPDVGTEVVCIDVDAGRLYLAPCGVAPSLAPQQPASFRLADAAGLLVVRGTFGGIARVTVNGVPQEALCLEVSPAGVERRNRRNHFRVAVALRCEFVPLGPGDALRESWSSPVTGSALPHLESFARSLAARSCPCVLKDLSLGGARLALESPAPGVGEQALLHISLGSGEAVRSVPCVVVQSRPGALSGDLDALVRVRFAGLSAPVEGRLGRYISRVQLDQLKRGVRT